MLEVLQRHGQNVVDVEELLDLEIACVLVVIRERLASAVAADVQIVDVHVARAGVNPAVASPRFDVHPRVAGGVGGAEDFFKARIAVGAGVAVG